MSRIISIVNCNDCPHKDHKGAFGNPRYVPVCRKTNRTLPYGIGVNYHGLGGLALYTGVIPRWCPLETT